MLASDRTVDDLLADPFALRLPLQPDDVPVLLWPERADTRAAWATAGLPRLLLVTGARAAPTRLDPLEDWVRAPVSAVDLSTRATTVARRHRQRMQDLSLDDGLLWRGRRWVDLPPVQLAVVTLLVTQPGRVVPREHLEAAVARAGGSLAPTAFASGISRLRQRLEALDLQLHALSGGRFVLEIVPPDGPPDPPA